MRIASFKKFCAQIDDVLRKSQQDLCRKRIGKNNVDVFIIHKCTYTAVKSLFQENILAGYQKRTKVENTRYNVH